MMLCQEKLTLTILIPAFDSTAFIILSPMLSAESNTSAPSGKTRGKSLYQMLCLLSDKIIKHAA